MGEIVYQIFGLFVLSFDVCWFDERKLVSDNYKKVIKCNEPVLLARVKLVFDGKI
jgi:hypothetical protein